MRWFTFQAVWLLCLVAALPLRAQDTPVEAPLPAPVPAATTGSTGPADDPEPPPNYRVPPPPPGSRYPGVPGGELSAGQDEADLRIPSRISTRLRVLSTDLDALAARGGSSVAGGILSIVTGGLSITLGVLFDDPSISLFFYVFGSASIARGTIDLVLAPDPYTPALEFSHMPMRDIGEVKRRLRYGESSLESLSDRNRTSRILDGTISIGAGVAIVPLVLAPNDFAFDSALDYFVVIGAGISVLSGVISLLTPTDAERRWEAYTQLRARLSRDRRRSPEPEARLQARLLPTRDGAILSLSAAF